MKRTILAFGLATALWVPPASPARAEPLEASVAVRDITPPVGYRMSGYFHERRATGTANPLRAKALVLKQGDVTAAVVSCDLIGLSRDVSDRARRAAAEAAGIPAEHILLAATHTHTGPLYTGVLRNHFHAQTVAKEGKDPAETVDYPALLAKRIAGAVKDASEALAPARLAAGTAEQRGLSFNRRFHMKNGPVRFNPGMKNPDIVRPAGPIDPQVGIVTIRRPDDKHPLAAVVNFALHLDTVGGTQYAADFPYFLERRLREAWGEGFTLLFGTGTCGDINHLDFVNGMRLKTEVIGRTLGDTVTAADLAPLDAPALAVARKVVRVPLQAFTDEEVAWAKEAIHKVGSRDLPFLERVRAYKILACEMRRAEAPDGKTLPLEVQVLRLSETCAVVGLPGEVFVDLGLAIKRASPLATTLVIELCQDAPGYIPTEKAFREGSYETVNSRVAPGGGERMVEAAVELLEELAGAAE
ncbi:MAG: hypothetical protein R6X20_02740 [Phycisphaerae bacterium]